MTNRATTRGEKGFTLLEMMAVLAILAILVALAAPSFNHLVLQNRLSAAVEEIVTVADLARQEAIMRSHTVRLVPVDATDWGAGLQVIVDNDRDGGFTDGLLFRSETVRAGLAVGTADDHQIDGGHVTFNALGQLDNLSDVVDLFIKSSNCTYPVMMRIQLMPSGETVVTQEECA